MAAVSDDGVRLPKVLQYTQQASKRGGDALERARPAGRRSTPGAATGSPRVLTRYRKEVARLLAEVAFGSGALAVIGGTVVIVVFMTFFTGLEVGQQGYNSLNSARRRGLHGLRLGLLQHPRDRADHRRASRCRRRSAAASPRSSAPCG